MRTAYFSLQAPALQLQRLQTYSNPVISKLYLHSYRFATVVFINVASCSHVGYPTAQQLS